MTRNLSRVYYMRKWTRTISKRQVVMKRATVMMRIIHKDPRVTGQSMRRHVKARSMAMAKVTLLHGQAVMHGTDLSIASAPGAQDLRV
jgi:hypothetical protein